jgi:hypothetical protein
MAGGPGVQNAGLEGLEAVREPCGSPSGAHIVPEPDHVLSRASLHPGGGDLGRFRSPERSGTAVCPDLPRSRSPQRSGTAVCPDLPRSRSPQRSGSPVGGYVEPFRSPQRSGRRVGADMEPFRSPQRSGPRVSGRLGRSAPRRSSAAPLAERMPWTVDGPGRCVALSRSAPAVAGCWGLRRFHGSRSGRPTGQQRRLLVRRSEFCPPRRQERAPGAGGEREEPGARAKADTEASSGPEPPVLSARRGDRAQLLAEIAREPGARADADGSESPGHEPRSSFRVT